jgi:hypothetical protein
MHYKNPLALQRDQDTKKRNYEIFFYFKNNTASTREIEYFCDAHITVSLAGTE